VVVSKKVAGGIAGGVGMGDRVIGGAPMTTAGGGRAPRDRESSGGPQNSRGLDAQGWGEVIFEVDRAVLGAISRGEIAMGHRDPPVGLEWPWHRYIKMST